MYETRSYNFTPEYVADVLKGYSAHYKNGVRNWRIDKERLRRLDFIANIINPVLKDKIIEIGCGFGPLIFRIINKGVFTNCIGLDISLDTLVPASCYFKKMGFLKNVKFILGNGEKIPCKNGSFNKAILMDVLEHMDDVNKKNVLFEAFRVLEDDGVLLINTPNLTYLSLAMHIKKLIYSITFRDTSIIDIPQTPHSREKGDHIGLTTIRTLKSILLECGFKEIKFHFRPDNIYGSLIALLCIIFPPLKEQWSQTITLYCKKG